MCNRLVTVTRLQWSSRLVSACLKLDSTPSRARLAIDGVLSTTSRNMQPGHLRTSSIPVKATLQLQAVVLLPW